MYLALILPHLHKEQQRTDEEKAEMDAAISEVQVCVCACVINDNAFSSFLSTEKA